MYKLLLTDVHNNVYNHKWITSVKCVLDDVECTCIWLSQCSEITSASVSRSIINIRRDGQYLHHGILIMIARLRLPSYKLFKNTVKYETYLTFGEKHTGAQR